MDCPNCNAEMESMTVEGHLTGSLAIDVCAACQAFWFDKYEDLKLAPASTLRLIKFIGEHTKGKPSVSPALHCPRCGSRLKSTHDMQRNTRFSYWRCDNEHGRFIGFLDFLREKDFIKPLSPQQLEELKKSVQFVNCSNCGAPIDLNAGSTCSHCGSPITMLDMKQPQELLAQLQAAAQPKPADPTLQLQLEQAKLEIENELRSAPETGLHASLGAFARWLTKSGI